MRKVVLRAVIWAGLLMACDANRIVDEYTSIEPKGWSYVDTVGITLPVTDTSKSYNLYLNVRHAGSYAYRNLYVRLHLQNPDGEKATQTVSFDLADAAGKWYGKGLGDLYEYRVLWREGARFKKPGNYNIQIEQFMREDPLPGISDIGLRLEFAE